MSRSGAFRALIVVVACVALSSCRPPQSLAAGPSTTLSTTTATSLPTASPTLTPELEAIPSITGVTWEAANHSVGIAVDSWPPRWQDWTMYVDGKAFFTGEDRGIDLRPNAPLTAPPDGLILGSLPWVGPLDQTEFPCCGSLQFSVPGAGMTNSIDYNLVQAGCVTAATKVCKSEWAVHEGDWTIDGGKTETIENTKLLQKGNIYTRSSSSLVVRNSELMIERGNTPTVHVYIFVDPGASLIIDGSKVYPGPDNGGLTSVWNRGKTTIINSPTSIHYLDMGEGAELTIDDSSMIYDIGGLLQVTGGKTVVSNSTLGAVGLNVPAGAHLEATGLRFGVHFDHWQVQDMIPEAPYELTFDNVTILEDFGPGEFEHGPFERGWIFFLDPSAHVSISDSQVRKIFLDLQGGTAEFDGLRIGQPASFEYRDIILQDVTATGEWSFTMTDAAVAFHDSTYLFLQPSGASDLKLVDSHMVEFIPRDFTGTITFENAQWTNAGEILGGVGYHSAGNNFKMAGSIKMDAELKQNLQWQDATVTREFEVIVTDKQGDPISQASVKFGGKEQRTDEDGRARFSVVFDETNYDVGAPLEVSIPGAPVSSQNIDFFTETPIRVKR